MPSMSGGKGWRRDLGSCGFNRSMARLTTGRQSQREGAHLTWKYRRKQIKVPRARGVWRTENAKGKHIRDLGQTPQIQALDKAEHGKNTEALHLPALPTRVEESKPVVSYEI